MEYEKVGLFIKEKRMGMNITQQELASRLSVDVTTVSKWERGKSFPDSFIVTKLCENIGINEHELFLACEDQDYRNAKEELNKIQKRRNVFYYTLTLSYLTAVIICFIVNIAVNHTLSWFFIVFVSCLTGYVFIPSIIRYFKKYKIEAYSLSTFISLVILFLTISIYTDNYWCFIAIIGTLFGYFLFFYPFIFFKYLKNTKIKKYFLLSYVIISELINIVLVLVINAYKEFDIILSLKIILYSYIPLLISGFVGIFDSINKEIKGSIILFSLTLFFIGLNGVLNNLLDPGKKDIYKVDFSNFNMYSNGNVTLIGSTILLIISIVLLIIGIVHKKK